MKKLKILLVSVFLSALIAINTGCVYEQITPVPAPPTVSFNEDVIPILTNSCATATCHATGKVAPDLSAGNAYLSLTLFGYVNTDSPDESLLMVKLTTGSMKDQATEEQKAIIRKWIEQGANDD